MSTKSIIQCPTSRCVASKYPNVYDFDTPTKRLSFMPDATAHCESCGGYTNGKEWKHVCLKCGATVLPGELVGLFVPHHCRSCEDKIIARDKATGNICMLCRQPRSQCCC